MKKGLKHYLNLNYPVTVETYREDGEELYALEIPDLQGCGAAGKTFEEAIEKLLNAKELWIKESLKRGLSVPEPVSEDDFSGKFLLRIPTKLHMALSRGAKHASTSLNQYVRSLLDNQIANADLMSEIKGLLKTVVKQTQAIGRLDTRLRSLEHRMGSLEDAYSSASEGRLVHYVTMKGKAYATAGVIPNMFEPGYYGVIDTGTPIVNVVPEE